MVFAMTPSASQNNVFKLLENIVLLYFGNMNCVAIFEHGGETSPIEELSWPNPSVLNQIVYNGNLRENILTTINLGCGVHILISDSTNQTNYFFDAYEKAVAAADRRIGDKKMIILLNNEEYVSTEEQKSIFNHSLFLGFPDVLLIARATPEYYELSTTKYVGIYNHNERVHLDTWYTNGTFRTNTNLFSNKMKDMQGRGLRVVMFNYKPYTIWTRVPFGGNAGLQDEGPESYGTVEVDGTEMRACVEFCNKHNCTISLVIEEEDLWGEIYDNGTGIGLLGALSEGRADVGLAALYSWYHEYGFLDLSLPMVRTGITAIAPAPTLQPGWLIPVRPFSSMMWLAMLVSLSVSIIAGYLINRLRNIPKNSIWRETFILMRYVLLQAPQDADGPNYDRYMISGVLLLSLMLSNAYGGGLASVMTVPIYGTPIDTVKDLAYSNINWGANSGAWLFSMLSATEPELIKLISTFRTMSDEELIKISKTRTFAFSLERLPAGHFAIGDYVKEDVVDNLRLMKEDIYWEQCVAMMPKSSPLLNSYNMHILKMLETGLPAIWESQVSMKHQNTKVQLAIKLSSQGAHDQTGPVSLRPDHLLGVYVAWGFGICLSTVVFFIELLMKKFEERYKNQEKEEDLNSVQEEPIPGYSGDLD